MKIKKINLLISLVILITLSFFWVNVVTAGTFDQIIKGFKNTGQNAGYEVKGSGAPKQEFVPAWGKYVNGLIMLMAFLFMILVIYGGWLWMTARGKEEQVEKGKNIIIQGVIGLGIVVGARIITEIALTYLGQTLPS